MADIATELGLSVSTVSLAIRQNPRIPEETRNRVVATAQRLGYKINPVVAELMSELRRHRGTEYQRTFALLNALPSSSTLNNHPVYMAARQGCLRRAELYGYTIDEFWLHEPALTPARLAAILHTRNIHGAIIVGPQLPEYKNSDIAQLWRDLTCVGIGLASSDLPFSNTRVDHHGLMSEAVHQLLASGYRRPALILNAQTEQLHDGRLSAGYVFAQNQLASVDRLPVYSHPGSLQVAAHLLPWLEQKQPDVLLCSNAELLAQLSPLGWPAPERVGFVLLDRVTGFEHCTHLDQRHELQGEAAIDLLTGLLTHHQRETPETTRLILNRARWVQGATTKARARTSA